VPCCSYTLRPPPRPPLFPYTTLFRSGLPPHRKRVTDLDPKKAKRAERVVYSLFYISIAGSLGAVLAYMFFPIETGELMAIRLHRSEEHTSELQSRENLVCRLLLEKKN